MGNGLERWEREWKDLAHAVEQPALETRVTSKEKNRFRDLSWIQILTNLTNLPNGDKLTLYHYISRLYYPSLFAYWLTQEAHKHELSMFFTRLGGMEINHQLRVFSI